LQLERRLVSEVVGVGCEIHITQMYRLTCWWLCWYFFGRWLPVRDEGERCLWKAGHCTVKAKCCSWLSTVVLSLVAQNRWWWLCCCCGGWSMLGLSCCEKFVCGKVLLKLKEEDGVWKRKSCNWLRIAWRLPYPTESSPEPNGASVPSLLWRHARAYPILSALNHLPSSPSSPSSSMYDTSSIFGVAWTFIKSVGGIMVRGTSTTGLRFLP